MTRFDLAPLIERLDINPTDHHAARTLAQHLHIDRRNARRLLTRGTLNDRQADRYAITIGCHPVTIWGQAWWSSTDSDEALPGWFADDLDTDEDDPEALLAIAV